MNQFIGWMQQSSSAFVSTVKRSFVALMAMLLVISMAGCKQAAPPGTVYYVHTDNLGTPVAITDANQQTVWEGHKLPFGDTDVATQTIAFNPRLPGQYYDAESGLNYNYHRDYDPTIGRYVQSDPIGLVGGNNTYAYALLNPSRYSDRKGLDSLDDENESEDAFGSEESKWEHKEQQWIENSLNPSIGYPNCPQRISSAIFGSGLGGKLPKPPKGPGSVPKSERDPKRFFTPSERETKREEQGHRCANCGAGIDGSNSAGHHIERHADGGSSVPGNHAEVCNPCHKDLHS